MRLFTSIVLLLMVLGGLAFWFINDRPDTPPIAQGLDLGPGGIWANSRWTATLKRQFPLGSPDWDVQDTLKAQGFRLDQSNQTAEYESGWPVCKNILRARWTTNANHEITSLVGTYGSVCS